MNFFEYIGISEDDFIEKYLKTGLVAESLHKDFPLNLYTYSRKAVHENLWDGVTSKCRGIVIHRDSNEVIARPFEKFHNYGTTSIEGTSPETNPLLFTRQPEIIEKVDGFLCTLYRWGGEDYIASKGSFHSIHAKWATAEYRKQYRAGFPLGWTPMFEGLCRDLRIVLDYGDQSGLVLLALINNETGREIPPSMLREFANRNGVRMARVFNISLDQALSETREENVLPGEGYVLTWYNEDGPPTRLKLKYVEYLRLHRMVTGVSPKRIWEVLSQAHLKSELNEYLDSSTPWFTKFVLQWKTDLEGEFNRIQVLARGRYYAIKKEIDAHRTIYGFDNLGSERKMWALAFLKEENREFASIMFAMLDGKDEAVVIWKQVKKMTTNGRPLVDIHTN